jgi:hypothetical protein
MERTIETQSLLPWLDPGASKIYLDVSLQIKSLTGQGKLDSPFRLLDSSSPLFHLIHASYRTPSGKPVKEVFLLIQKDHYSFTEKSVPFNNTEIDKLWQDAFNFGGLEDGLESLDCLVDSSVHQAPFPLWRSLFYCENCQCYFHPPCPQCGSLLELCSHDEILSAAGLPLYSTTLERFLFCPVCHEDQSANIFYSQDVGDDVYPNVKSFPALIDGFLELVNNGLGGENFPCQTCQEQDDCFSSELVHSRIIPFAFYPFRMLITDAAQLPGQDFVSIISGAPCKQIIKQPHMVKEPQQSFHRETLQQQSMEGIQLFFENDPKKFLEILYLKIAFLEQITQTFFVAQKNLKHPDLRLSMDQIWIDFPNYQGLLPYFWNFKVKPVALGIFPSEEISFIRVPNSLGLYSLALLWFNTLLVNKEQSAINVQRALAILLDKESSSNSETGFPIDSVDDNRVFEPENIFWFPLAKQMPHLWFELWHKVLGLGWSLLQASLQSPDFSNSVFADEISHLVKEVKKALFASESAPEGILEPALPEKSDEFRDTADSEILRILLNLREKWLDDTVAVSENVVSEPEPVHCEIVKEEVGQTTEGDVEAEEDLEETVIINLNDLDSMLSDAKSSVAASEQQNTTMQPEDGTNEDLSETVIISLEELEKLKKGKNGHK